MLHPKTLLSLVHNGGICWLVPLRLKLVFPSGCGTIKSRKVGRVGAKPLANPLLTKKMKQNLSINKKNEAEPIHGSPQQWLKHLRK